MAMTEKEQLIHDLIHAFAEAKKWMEKTSDIIDKITIKEMNKNDNAS